jgi:hypothetical protein
VRPGDPATRPAGPRLAAPALLLLAAALAVAACHEAPQAPEPATGAGAQPAAPRFEPARLDLGVVAAGAWLERRVLLRNETPRSIRLAGIEAPCECTTTDLALPVELSPGEALEVPLVVDLSVLTRGGAPGQDEPGPKPLRRQVTVVTDEEARATLEVELAVSSALVIEPMTLSWAAADLGRPLAGEITVRSGRSGGEAHLRQVISRGAPPPEVARHDEGGATLLTVAWGPFDGPGERRASLLLVTGEPELPEVEIELQAQVVGPVVVSPEEIVAQAALPTRPVVQTLVVSRRDGEPVRILSARCDEHRVRVSLTPAQPHVPEARVQVVVPVLPHPRELTGTVELVTDVAGGIVRVPIRVRARPPA